MRRFKFVATKKENLESREENVRLAASVRLIGGLPVNGAISLAEDGGHQGRAEGATPPTPVGIDSP